MKEVERGKGDRRQSEEGRKSVKGGREASEASEGECNIHTGSINTCALV